MKGKMLFVFNPHSGKGQIKTKLLEIINVFSVVGYEVTTYPTQKAKDAYDAVCNADGMYECVVCSGGDGTLNEVIGAVLTHRISRPRIGYIPAGSTNDFAATLGLPKDMVKAAKAIVKGHVFSCDIGKFNDKMFNYVAAFGVFTDISYTTPQNVKNVFGHQAYILESMKSFSKIEAAHMNIRNGTHVVSGDFIYGMIANTESVGGFKGLCGTEILLDDGLFEITLVREPKTAMDMQLIASGLLSGIDNNPMVERFKADHLIIESEPAVPWTLDGEYGEKHHRVEISVLPKVVDIIVP